MNCIDTVLMLLVPATGQQCGEAANALYMLQVLGVLLQPQSPGRTPSQLAAHTASKPKRHAWLEVPAAQTCARQHGCPVTGGEYGAAWRWAGLRSRTWTAG